MIVAFDASLLVFVFSPNAKAPIDSATGDPVTRCPERIKLLLETLERDRARVIVPAPALAEVMVRADPSAAAAYLTEFERSRFFKLAGFEKRAAVEFVAMEHDRFASETRRILGGGAGTGARAKAKFDQQIVAIAKVEGASMIFSDDGDIRKLATRNGMEVVGVAELPLPPEPPQGELFEEDPEAA